MRWVTVNDKMQKNYKYQLTEKPGLKMDFKPAFTPMQMLKLGVFEGKYCRDCGGEFPKNWFKGAKFVPPESNIGDPKINYFGIKSRQSLQEWIRKGWIPLTPDDKDVRGWFQWYMRYYYGRRMPSVDVLQIKRWNAIARHAAQVKKHCTHKNQHGRCKDPKNCRPKQRQTLLQWAWDCFI